MLKKHELSNPASCLNKAGANELVFVLRENDPLFAAAVRHWATMADGVHEPAKIAEANACAATAEKNRANRDAPDTPYVGDAKASTLPRASLMTGRA